MLLDNASGDGGLHRVAVSLLARGVEKVAGVGAVLDVAADAPAAGTAAFVKVEEAACVLVLAPPLLLLLLLLLLLFLRTVRLVVTGQTFSTLLLEVVPAFRGLSGATVKAVGAIVTSASMQDG